MEKNLFITGKPACGKTTLIREVMLPHVARCGGFYTEEIKEGSVRAGFLLRTIDGKTGVLAKKGMPSTVKLNKYGVDVQVLEGLAVTALQDAVAGKDIIVIDELGSMEIFSENFRRALLACLNSPKRVIATIRHNSQPFTDEIKRMADTKLLYLSRDNAAEIKSAVKAWFNHGQENSSSPE